MDLDESFLKSILNVKALKRPSFRRGFPFSKCFESSLGHEGAARLVAELDEYREQLLEILPSGNVILAIQTIDKYIPCIFNLLESLRGNSVHVDRQLSFEWKGAITTGDYSQYCEIIFEIAMSLHSKAILHYEAAFDLISTNIAQAPVAVQHLRIGAGVLTYLSSALLPQWRSESKATSLRPAEVCEPVCSFLSMYFTAVAQQITFYKALVKDGGSPPSLLSKLALAVSNCMSVALNAVSIQDEYKGKIDSDLLAQVGSIRELFLVQSYVFHAHSLYAANEVADAIVYCQIASVCTALTVTSIAALVLKYIKF
jgi:hypothetical protein